MPAFSKAAYGYSRTDLPIRQSYFFGSDPSTRHELVLAMFADSRDRDYWSDKFDCLTDSVVPFETLPRSLIKDAVRQLSIVHGVGVPDPVDGVFVDWTAPPFHGGWHHRQPGYKSWEIVQQAVKPLVDLNLHLCGDTFSPVLGWVEGALLSVEQVLQQAIDLPPPKWHRVEQQSARPA